MAEAEGGVLVARKACLALAVVPKNAVSVIASTYYSVSESLCHIGLVTVFLEVATRALLAWAACMAVVVLPTSQGELAKP